MRTCERCNTSKRNSLKKAPTKKAATRWPSIWGRAGDIPFSKSSGQRRTPRDGRFGERLYRGGRAILRFWWLIRLRLTACWDGPASAIWVTSSLVRGGGCRKTRRPKKRLLRQAHAFEQVEIPRIRVKGLKKILRASTFNTQRLDHIYLNPHTPEARLFLYYGDRVAAGALSHVSYNAHPGVG